MSLVVGIDPGVEGAFALYDASTRELCAVWDTPVLEIKEGKTVKRRIDINELVLLVSEIAVYGPELALVEKVGGLPGQSAPAGFSFGFSVGALHTALAVLKIPRQTVAPAVWKRAMRVTDDKDGARAMASMLLPGAALEWRRKKDHGRAEAALIAVYGARYVLRVEKRPPAVLSVVKPDEVADVAENEELEYEACEGA